jgi:hypothetical protein
MFELAHAGAPVGAPGVLRAGRMNVSARLVPVAGFPFSVTASRRERPAAKRIARKALAAANLLHSVLGLAPRLALRVLGRDDWPRGADAAAYGVTHVASDGCLVAGAEPADEWHAVSDHFAEHLPARDLAHVIDVHGLDPINRRGPALRALAESLIAHEVAHLLAAQQAAVFERRWLEEAFANYALVAVLGETDPAGLRLVGSLAEAATALDAQLPTLTCFERHFGQMDVVPSVLAELAITRGVYAAYAARRVAPLARLFASAADGAAACADDEELGRRLAADVHPAIAAIPARFACARIGLAA